MKLESKNFIFHIGGGSNLKQPKEPKKPLKVDSVARKIPRLIVREARLALDDPILRTKAAIGIGGTIALAIIGILISSFFFVASIGPVTAGENEEIVKSSADFSAKDRPTFLIKTDGIVKQEESVETFYLKEGRITVRLKNAGDMEIPISPEITSIAGSEDQFLISVPEDTPMRPGKHKLQVELVNGNERKVLTQEFSWGVLAINFGKSSYSVGEKVDIGMAVLDDIGKTICDASLELEITNPEGKTEKFETGSDIISSDLCADKSVTDKPDYLAEYETASIGTYKVKLTAETKNGRKTIDDQFIVSESPHFLISRETSMRINPVAEYKVRLKVIAKEDFEGNLTEIAPDSFEIKDLGYLGSVLKNDQETRITWAIALMAGQEQEFEYTYKAPPISPELYLLGPATISLPVINGDNGGEERDKIVFSEPRPWQIAADSTLTYVGGKSYSRAGSTSTYNLTLTNLTGGVAAAPASGDVVIISTATGSTVDRALAISGYSELAELYTNGTSYDTNLDVSWKRMTSTPDTSVTIPSTGSTSDAQSVQIKVWRNVDAATPFDVTRTVNTGTATGRPTPPAISPSTAGAVVIVAGAGAATTGAVYTNTAVADFRSVSASDNTDSMSGMGYYRWASGTYTPSQFTGGTTNSGDSWAAVTMALRPASGADPDEIQYVGTMTNKAAGSTGTNLTINLRPLNPQTGDLIIVTTSTGSVADRSIGPTAGQGYAELMSELYTNGTSYDTNMDVSWKIVGAVPDTQVVIGPSGNASDAMGAVVQIWRNVDTSNPFDVTTTTNTGTATGRPTPPAIGPSTTGSVVVIAGSGAATTGALYTNTTLNGFVASTSADSYDAMTAMGYYRWTSGTYTPSQFTGGTANTGDSWAAATMALRPSNIPPTLTINQPDGTNDTVNAGASYNINYDLADSDDVVTVAFSYDTDTNSGNGTGTAIAGACATAAEGTGANCSWDTTGVSAGSYYIYGTSSDEADQVSDYSPGQITIQAVASWTTLTQRSGNIVNDQNNTILTSHTAKKGEKLRVKIQLETNSGGPAAKDFKLQYDKNDSNWVDVKSSSEVRPALSTVIKNKQVLGGPEVAACSTGTWHPGTAYEGTARTDWLFIDGGDCREIEFTVDTKNAVVGTTYRFRLIDATSATTLTYSSYPSFNVVTSGNDTFKSSKSLQNNLSTGYQDLKNLLDKQGYDNVNSDDSAREILSNIGDGAETLNVIHGSNALFGYSSSGAGDVNGDGYDDIIVGADFYSSYTGRAYILFGGPQMDDTFDVTLNGEASSDFGISVSGAGDVNGDGYDDVIVGAKDYSSNAGRAYIFYGSKSMNSSINASSADVIMTGQTAGDRFGKSVSDAGDVNNDGFYDVVVGAYGFNKGSGRAYIFLGGSSMNNVADVTIDGTNEFASAVSNAGDVNGDGYDDVIIGNPIASYAYIYHGGSTMNNVADVTIIGIYGDYFGISVSGAGDVNGDGYGDVIVGADNYSSATGRAFVYYGGSSMDTTADVTMTGESASNHYGAAVSDAGDINGDGYSDVLVGAYGYNPGSATNTGKAYLYYGGSSMNNGYDSYALGESSEDYLGRSVSGAGDLNGDGFADLIIGADYYGDGLGQVYVFTFGRAMNNTNDIYVSGSTSGDSLGFSVANAGDLNGDGYDDLIAGAPGYGTDRGAASVWYGGSNLNLVPDVSLTGEADNDLFGLAVAGVGDLNGDGYGDVAVSGFNDSTSTIKTYVFYGGTSMNNVADLTITKTGGDEVASVSGAGDVNGDGYDDLIVGDGGVGQFDIYYGGSSMNNIADVSVDWDSYTGFSVSSAGDINGDGYDDVIVGNVGSPSYTYQGAAYIYYGGSSMNNTIDVTIDGESAGDWFGNAVDGGQDVNGDGISDVIVGAQRYPGGGYTGRAYIFYGSTSLSSSIDASNANVIFTGAGANYYYGHSVSLGDVNGDGYADASVGMEDYSAVAGIAYTYFGGPNMDTTADVTNTEGTTSSEYGYSLDNSGDYNGDGFADLFSGAYRYDVSSDEGRIYINFGGGSPASPGAYNVYNFANKFATACSGFGGINATWNGQSSVAASGKNIVLQVYRFGSTNAWETVTTNSSLTANTDGDISGSRNTNLAEYCDASNWSYWRAYQAAGNNIFRTDSWSLTSGQATATVSGNIYDDNYEENVLDTTNYGSSTVKISVNNGSPTNCNAPGDGTFSCSNVAGASEGVPLLVYIAGHANNANTLTVSSGGTTMTGLKMYRNHLAVDNHNSGTTTASNVLTFSTYPPAGDNTFANSFGDLAIASGNELHIMAGKSFSTGTVMISTTSGGLHLDDGATATLGMNTNAINGNVIVDSGATLNVNADTMITGGGGMYVDGTLTRTSGSATITTTGDISGSGTIGFYNLVIGNVSAASTTLSSPALVTGSVAVSSGSTFIINADLMINGGSITTTGTGSITTTAFSTVPTITLVAAGTIGGGSGIITFPNLVLDDGDAATTVASDFSVNGQLFVDGTTAVRSLNASSKVITLKGSGLGTSRPFYLYGNAVLTPGTSTITYAGPTVTEIQATTYNNLHFKPTYGTPTYTLGTNTGQTVATQNQFTVGNGTNGVIVRTTTGYDPTVNIGGTLTVEANATFSGNGDGTVTVNGNVMGGGTINFNSSATGLTRSTSGLLLYDDFSTNTEANYTRDGSDMWGVSGGNMTYTHNNSYGALRRADISTAACVTSKVRNRTANDVHDYVLVGGSGGGGAPYYHPTNGYYIQNNWGELYLFKAVNDTETALDSDSYGTALNTWYLSRVYIDGTSVYGKFGTTALGNLLSGAKDPIIGPGHAAIFGGYAPDVDWDWLDIRTSHEVTVKNLPSGYYAKVSDGTNTAKATTSAAATGVLGPHGSSGWSGMAWGTVSGNNKYGNLLTLTETSKVSKVTAMVASMEGAKNIKAAIYRAGDGALVATSEAVVVDGSQSIWDFPFASAPELLAGDYWLTIIGDTGTYFIMSKTDSGSVSSSNADTYSDGPSNPHGFSSFGTTKYYINASTYTTGDVATVDAGNVLFPLASLAIYNGDPDSGGSLVTTLTSSNYPDMGGGDVFDFSALGTGGTFDHRPTASSANFGSTSGSNDWSFNNLIFSSSGGSQNFGDTSADASSNDSYSANEILARRFNMNQDGFVSSLSLRAKYGGTQGVFRLLVYADNGSNLPGVLKAYTGLHTITSDDTNFSWHTEPVVGDSVYLTAGNYWLSYQIKSGTIYTSKTTNDIGDYGRWIGHTWNDIPTDPFPSPSDDWNPDNEIYATYTSLTEIDFATGGTGKIITNGTLQVGKATDGATVTIDNNTNDRIIDANGSVNITSKGSYSASSSASFTIADDFTNDGTFVHNLGTVTFDSTTEATLTYTANTTFHGLYVPSTAAGKQIKFDKDQSTIITGALTIQGTNCTTGRVFLDSETDNDAWPITVTGATLNLDYVDIEDSAGTGSPVADNSTAVNGGNTGWTINAGACSTGITVSGSVYQTDETTKDTTAYTIKASANNGSPVSCTLSSGDYSCANVAATSAGTPVMVYIEGHSNNANTVTVSGGSAITGLHLAIGRLGIGNNNSGSTTNANIMTFATYPAAGDKTFSGTSPNLTVSSGYELHVINSKTYDPGGIVEVSDAFHSDDSSTAYIDTYPSTICNVTIDSGASLYLDTDVAAYGDITVNGTLGYSTGTPSVYTGYGTISGSGTKNFYSLLDDESTTIAGAVTAVYVGLDTGETFTINADLTVTGGNIETSANSIITTTSGTPTVTLGSSGNIGGGSGDSITFYNLTLADGAATTTANSNFTVKGQLKVDGTTQARNLNASSKTITLAGSGTGTSRPFYLYGNATFTSGTSTIVYAGTSGTDITSTTYNNLHFKPTSNSPTYALGHATSQTLTVNNQFTVGNGTNPVTVTHNAGNYDPILNVGGTMTVDANATLSGNGSSTITVNGSVTGGGTINLDNSAASLKRSSSGLILYDDFSVDTEANYAHTSGPDVFSVNSGAMVATHASGYDSRLYRPDITNAKVATTRVKEAVVGNWTQFIGIGGNGDHEDLYANGYVVEDTAADYLRLSAVTDSSYVGLDEVSIPALANNTYHHVRSYIDNGQVYVLQGTSILTQRASASDSTFSQGQISFGSYDGTNSWDWIEARTSQIITVSGLPAGYFARVSDGNNYATSSNSGGTVTIDAGGVLFPLAYFYIYNSLDEAVVVLDSSDIADMGGGDVFSYSAGTSTGVFEQRVSTTQNFGSTAGFNDWNFNNLTFSNPDSSFVGSQTGEANSASSITVNIPANANSGDTLLALVFSYTSGSNNISHTGPVGWTKIAQQTGTLYSTWSIWWKTMAPVDSNPNFTLASGSGDLVGLIGVYRGLLPTNVVDTYSNTAYQVSNSSLQAAGITTGSADLVVHMGAMYIDGGGHTITPPVGWTEDHDSYTNNMLLAASHKVFASSQATSTQDATVDNSGYGNMKHAFQIGLKINNAPTVTMATGGSGKTITSGTLQVGKDTDAYITTLDNNTNDRIIDANSDLTITSKGVLSASSSAAFSIGGSYSNSGSFTHNYGTITFDASTTGKTITSNSSTNKFCSVVFNGAGGEWTLQDNFNQFNGEPYSQDCDTDWTAGTLIFNGYEYFAATGYRNVTLGSGFTLTVGTGSLVTWGNFVLGVGTGATLTISTGSIDLKDLVVDGTGTFTNTGSSTIYIAGGTVTITSPNWSAGGSTIVQYYDTGSYNVTQNLYNLQIGSVAEPDYSAAVSLASGLTVLNDLNILYSSGQTRALSLNTYNLTIGGNFTNGDTLNANSGTVTFDAGDTGNTLSGTMTGASAFYNIEFNNAAGAWQFNDAAAAVNNFTISNGAVTGPSTTLDIGGNLTINSGSTFSHNNGTLTFNGTGTSTWTDGTSGQNLGNIIVDGTAKNVNLASSAKATKIIVDADDIFGLGSSGYILELTGSGVGSERPLIVNGTLNEGTNSLVKYSGTSNTEVEAETYNNLDLKPSGAGSPTYTLGGEYNDVVMSDSPIAYYRLGESSGPTAYDETGNYNGAYQGTPTYAVNSLLPSDAANKALSQEHVSTDFVEIGHNAALNGSSLGLTMEIWAKADADNPDNAQALIQKRTTSGSNMSYGMFRYWPNINIDYGNGGGRWDTGVRWPTDYGTVHYVVATINLTNHSRQLWLDGELVAEQTGTSDVMPTNTGVLRIGQMSGSQNWLGDLDEAAVYNYPLSVDQIQAHYNAGLDTSTAKSTLTANNLTIGDGTNAVTVDNSPFDTVLDINGNFVISANGAYQASSSSALTVAGNFANSGSFIHNNGTVSFDGTSASSVSGNTTFKNLDIGNSGSGAKTVSFTGGSTTTITGSWNVSGASGKLITLQSTNTTSWSVAPTAATVDYANVARSNSTLPICATHSTDGGNNNANWDFSSGATCNLNPNSPASLTQKTSPAGADIAESAWTIDNTPNLGFTITDSDAGDTVKYQVQVADNSAFTTPIIDYTHGSLSASGTTFAFTVGSYGSGSCTGTCPATLPDDLEGYWWRVRAIDNSAAFSSYVEFGVAGTMDHKVDATACTGGTIQDGADATDDAYNDGSLSQLSAYWTGTEPNCGVSGVAKYEYAIGTTQGGTNVKTWTDLTAIFGNTSIESGTNDGQPDYMHLNKFNLGNPGSLTAIRLYLDNQQTGHATSEAVGVLYDDDGTGAEPGTRLGYTSPFTIADNQAAGWITIPFSTSVPLSAGDYYLGVYFNENANGVRVYFNSTGGTFRVYQRDYSADLGVPPANWSAASDSHYTYKESIQGIVAPTNVTASGLNLQTGQMYYFTVRTTDNAGNTSTVSSNGQMVLPTFTVSIGGNVDMGSWSNSNSYTTTGTTAVSVSTNAYHGFIVQAFKLGALHSVIANADIPDISANYTTPAAWPGGGGFGFTTTDCDVNPGGGTFYSGSNCTGTQYWAPFATMTSGTGPGYKVADHTALVSGTAISNESNTITYKVQAAPTQAAGLYSTNIVYTVTPQY